MSSKLEAAFEAIRQMPPATQDSMADAILSLANGSTPLDIEEEHLAAVLEGLAQLERGEGVVGDPDELVAAAFDRHRPH